MSSFHLAQLNIAHLSAPIDSPQLADFVDNLDRINALADSAPGFIWRLQTEDGDATSIDYFGPEVIGLTGTQKQLTALTKRYRVTYGYGEPNDNGFYDVSHSSGVFVFGPDGTPRLLWNQSVTGDQMAADLKTLLGQLADADADAD